MDFVSDLPPGTEGYDELSSPDHGIIQKNKETPKNNSTQVEKYLKSHEIELDNGTILPMLEGKFHDGTWKYLCYPCGATCLGEIFLQNHLNGRKHTKNLLGTKWPNDIVEKHPYYKLAGKAKVDPKKEFAYNCEPSAEGGEVKLQSRFLQSIVNYNESPLIGMEYLIEIFNVYPPEFYCGLCNRKGDNTTIISHLIGFWHKLNFLEKNFPTAYRLIRPYTINKEYRKGAVEVVHNIAKRIEQAVTRTSPYVVKKELFYDDRDKYIAVVYNRTHLTEKDGDSFVEIVDKEYIEVISRTEKEIVPSTTKLSTQIASINSDTHQDGKNWDDGDLRNELNVIKARRLISNDFKNFGAKGHRRRRSLESISTISSELDELEETIDIAQPPHAVQHFTASRLKDHPPLRSRSNSQSQMDGRSPIRYRSPDTFRSHDRYRSPGKYRSPERRNRSPLRNRSPGTSRYHERLRSPRRNRSPMRSRSPGWSRSPGRNRSPLRKRSPVRSRSPRRYRSPGMIKSSHKMESFNRNVTPDRSRSPSRRRRSPGSRYEIPKNSNYRGRNYDPNFRAKKKDLTINFLKAEPQFLHSDKSGDTEMTEKNVYKVNLYHEKIKAATQTAVKIYEYHEKNPEKHPLYQDEWKKFWNKRFKELQAANKDAAGYDFKPEWIVFWGKRMKELHELDLEAKNAKICRTLGYTPETMKQAEKRIACIGSNTERASVSFDVLKPEVDKSGSLAGFSMKNWSSEINYEKDKKVDEPLEKCNDGFTTKNERKRIINLDDEGSSNRKDSKVRRLHSLSDQEDKISDKSLSPWDDDDSDASILLISDSPIKRSRDKSLSKDVVKPVAKNKMRGRVLQPQTTQKREQDISQTLGTEDTNMVAVLRLLTALENYLGSLGPKVVDLLGEALKLEKEKPNSSEDILDSDNYCVLFETVKEKLKGQLLAGLIDHNTIHVTKTAIKLIAALLHKGTQRAEARQKLEEQKKVEAKNKPVTVEGIGAVEKAAIANQIATALIAQGKTDVTTEELETLINAVVGMANASKALKVPVSSASFLAQLNREAAAEIAASSESNESHTDSSPGNALQMLQMAYTQKMSRVAAPRVATPVPEPKTDSAMEDLSDSDLKTLLLNFVDLSTDEQQGLIAYLKKLEVKEPERVEMLRKFIDIDPTTSGRSEQSVVRDGSPFSTRQGGNNPTKDENNSRDVPAESLDKDKDSDDDDYTFDEVFKSASEKVKEQQLKDDMKIIQKTLMENSSKEIEAKAIISNLMESLQQNNKKKTYPAPLTISATDVISRNTTSQSTAPIVYSATNLTPQQVEQQNKLRVSDSSVTLSQQNIQGNVVNKSNFQNNFGLEGNQSVESERPPFSSDMTTQQPIPMIMGQRPMMHNKSTVGDALSNVPERTQQYAENTNTYYGGQQDYIPNERDHFDDYNSGFGNSNFHDTRNNYASNTMVNSPNILVHQPNFSNDYKMRMNYKNDNRDFMNNQFNNQHGNNTNSFRGQASIRRNNRGGRFSVGVQRRPFRGNGRAGFMRNN